MNQETVFAVIIPVFNRSQSLIVCLDSIASQTLLPAQVVIVDDCSSEPHASEISKIAERYTGQFKTNILRLSVNSGPSYARNHGVGCMLDHITHVAYLDSDDTWHPCRLEVASSLFSRYGADIVLNRYCVHDTLPEASQLLFCLGARNNTASILKTWQALISNPCQTSCLAIRREAILPFPSGQRYCEDYFLILQALSANMMIVSTGIPLTILGRRQLSQGGLSSSIVRMRIGELKSYLGYCTSIQRRYLFPLLAIFSVAKMLRIFASHSFSYAFRSVLPASSTR